MQESPYSHGYRELLEGAEEALTALLDETAHDGLIYLRRGLGEICQAMEAEDRLAGLQELQARLEEMGDRLEEHGRKDRERTAAFRAKLDAPAAFQEQLTEINALPLTSTDEYDLEHRPDGPVSRQLMVIPRVLGWRRLPSLSGLTLLDLASLPRQRIAGMRGVGPATMRKIDAAMAQRGLQYGEETEKGTH
jgi:hypothetical protein